MQKQLKDSPIIFTEIEPNPATGNFIVNLSVPYSYIGRERIQLFKSIKVLLNNPENYAIYSYWSAYATRYQEQTESLDAIPFSMLSIESRIDYLSFSRPLPVWSAIVKELTKDDKLELLDKQLYLDKDSYQIKFVCKNGASNKL